MKTILNDCSCCEHDFKCKRLEDCPCDPDTLCMDCSLGYHCCNCVFSADENVGVNPGKTCSGVNPQKEVQNVTDRITQAQNWLL